MKLRYHRRRVAGRLAAGECAPRQQRARDQQRRLEALVRHAAERSPFYRERLAAAGVPALDRWTCRAYRCSTRPC
jgi:phenylacetate-coenzyme A ligase PaaK-like adenylate-forming protein